MWIHQCKSRARGCTMHLERVPEDENRGGCEFETQGVRNMSLHVLIGNSFAEHIDRYLVLTAGVWLSPPCLLQLGMRIAFMKYLLEIPFSIFLSLDRISLPSVWGSSHVIKDVPAHCICILHPLSITSPQSSGII